MFSIINCLTLRTLIHLIILQFGLRYNLLYGFIFLNIIYIFDSKIINFSKFCSENVLNVHIKSQSFLKLFKVNNFLTLKLTP